MTATGRTEWGEWPAFVDHADAQGITPACRDHDPALFFPDAGQSAEPACDVCDRCPLFDACRKWALAQPVYLLHGVWGGTTRRGRIHAAGKKGG